MGDYKPYTVDDVIAGLHASRHLPAIGGPPIPKPEYVNNDPQVTLNKDSTYDTKLDE